METRQRERKKIDLLDMVLGGWLLAHDLADRAIHSLKGETETGPVGALINQAHDAEEKLILFIRSTLKRLGLATSEDIKELQERIENLKKRR